MTDNKLNKNAKEKAYKIIVNTNNIISDQVMMSLVIPSFQEESTIAKLLELFPFEFKKKFNLEIILSDGGSTDKTLEIAQRYCVDKILVHNIERKQTISEGRNNGGIEASSNCVIFLNADTIPENPDQFFSEILKWAKSEGKYRNYQALATYVTYFKDDVEIKDKVFYALHNRYVKLLNMIGMGMGRGECQIVQRDVFLDVGCYNATIAAGEDFDLYNRISKKYKIQFASDLRVCESPRRFRKYGYMRIILSWTLNSLSVMFRGKSVSKEWEAVR